MAKGRKMRTFRKKIRGGQQENKYSYSPIDISKFRGQAVPKPTLKEIDSVTLTKDDIMGGKLRRTRKRRMTKRRKGVKKMIRKSRRMRGGDINDYLPSFITGKKPQQNYDMTNEYNSSFRTQQNNGTQPIEQYTDEEYKFLRENPNKFTSDKPIDEITIKKNSSWFPF
jgi:hypothetical protein